MNLKFTTALDIKFELVPDAPLSCIPTPIDSVMNTFRLKTKQNFSIAYNDIQRIATGIRIMNFPEFVMNPNSQDSINLFTEAHCIADTDLLCEYGLDVLGPQFINKSDGNEIEVILINRNKSIFYAEAGDDIAIITFEMKPFVNFTVDLTTQNIPKDLRNG